MECHKKVARLLSANLNSNFQIGFCIGILSGLDALHKLNTPVSNSVSSPVKMFMSSRQDDWRTRQQSLKAFAFSSPEVTILPVSLRYNDLWPALISGQFLLVIWDKGTKPEMNLVYKQVMVL